jgi:hypothetical protein
MATEKTAGLQITPPNFKRIHMTIAGNAPYVANKFPSEAIQEMAEKQRAGSQAKKGKQRAGKDFDGCFRSSMHTTTAGVPGVPASTFRKAMISACRLVGFKMTLAKLALFVESDDFDSDDGTPLVVFSKGEPHRVDSYVRNATGVADIRPRAHWDAGWEIRVRVKYDADLFSAADVINLFRRVGAQVGIGAGRPDSSMSTGLGWGTFDVVFVGEPEEVEVA